MSGALKLMGLCFEQCRSCVGWSVRKGNFNLGEWVSLSFSHNARRYSCIAFCGMRRGFFLVLTHVPLILLGWLISYGFGTRQDSVLLVIYTYF